MLRSASCLLGPFAVVAVLYAELPAEGVVAYRAKAEATVSHAIGAVRRRLWLAGVFDGHGRAEAFGNRPPCCGP